MNLVEKKVTFVGITNSHEIDLITRHKCLQKFPLSLRERAQEAVGFIANPVHALQETWTLRKFWSSEDWQAAMDTEPPAVSRASHKKEGEHFKSNDQGK